MKYWFWKDERFGWPLIVVIAFLTVSLLAADYIWRVTVMAADTFALYALGLNLAAVVLLVGVWRARRQTAKK